MPRREGCEISSIGEEEESAGASRDCSARQEEGKRGDGRGEEDPEVKGEKGGPHREAAGERRQSENAEDIEDIAAQNVSEREVGATLSGGACGSGEFGEGRSERDKAERDDGGREFEDFGEEGRAFDKPFRAEMESDGGDDGEGCGEGRRGLGFCDLGRDAFSFGVLEGRGEGEDGGGDEGCACDFSDISCYGERKEGDCGGGSDEGVSSDEWRVAWE